MRSGVESHQRGLAFGVGQKQVEQRAEFGQLVEFQHARSALFDGNHQRDRRRVHLLLYANLLRHAVVFQHKIALLQAVQDSAATLFYQGRHQNLSGRDAESGRVGLSAGHRLGSFNRGQLLRRDGHCRQQHGRGQTERQTRESESHASEQ